LKILALNKATEEYNEGIKDTSDALNAIIPGLGKVADLYKKNAEGSLELSKNLKSLGMQMSTQFLKSSVAMAKGLDESNVELAKQTGYTTALRQDVLDLAESHDGLYLSLGESTKAIGALSVGFKMYNTLSKETRTRVNDVAGTFLTMGVEAEATAAVLDHLNDGFGLTAPAAAAAAAELENLAIRTGQPLSAVVNDFRDLGPQMARFGIDGTRVFRRLNEQARTLGLTTRQAFDFSEMFDTFEGAANVAGKLNAQLGMQLNSVEMMTADSDERLRILRAEFDLRGMNFQTMGKRQKQMIADIMGTDITGASKLFGSPAELRKFQKEEKASLERREAYNTATKKFVELQEQMFINLAPLLNGIMETVNSIMELMNKIASSGFGTLVSYMGLIASVTASIFGVMGKIKIFGQVFSKILGFIVAPFLFLKDLLGTFGIGGDKDYQALSQKRLGLGAAGAAAGAGAGLLTSAGLLSAPMAAGGYTLAREGAEYVNDAVIPSGQSAIISQPGKRPIKTNRMDTISASTGDRGSLGDMNKALNEIKNLLAKKQDQRADIRLEIGGQRLDTFRNALLRPLDPTRARA